MLASSNRRKKKSTCLVFGYVKIMNSSLNINTPIPIINMILSYYYNKDTKNELIDNISDLLFSIFNKIDIIPYIILNKYSSFKQCQGCNKIQWTDDIQIYECENCGDDVYECNHQCCNAYQCDIQCEHIRYCTDCYQEINGSKWRNFPCHGSVYTDPGEKCCTVCYDNPCYPEEDQNVCPICNEEVAICDYCVERRGNKPICSDCGKYCAFCSVCHRTFGSKEELYKKQDYFQDNDNDDEDDWMSLLCVDCDAVLSVQEFKNIKFDETELSDYNMNI